MSARFTPPGPVSFSPDLMYGHLWSFSPFRVEWPGGSGFTVAAAAGWNVAALGERMCVTVPRFRVLVVDGGAPFDVQAVKVRASATSATAAHLCPRSGRCTGRLTTVTGAKSRIN